ncbi:MAG: OmpP1/FadL family transporter [Myxococcota bacterium]
MTSCIRRAALWAALTFATVSHASGFYFGDNGTKTLLQGGAFAAQADDLTAIQHNPGGLAFQTGTSFLLDSQLLGHDIRFTRKDADGRVPTNLSTVTNRGGLFLLPNLGGGYNLSLAGRPFTVAFGVYGPPSVGRYLFNEPDYTREGTSYVADPRKYAPNRYALIKNDVIILYPSLSASYALHPRIAVGASLQYVFSKFTFTQAVTSLLFPPARQFEEDPAFDSLVTVDLQGQPAVTGILGVLAKPTDSFSVGASVRPPVPLTARGKFEIALGEVARGLNTVVEGDQAQLNLTLPLEVRVGARFSPSPAWGLNADVVYLGWQSVQELLLTPEISTQIGSGAMTPVEPLHIPKRWRHTLSGRLGGSYSFGFGLTTYAGFLVEENASPTEYTNIDFLHPTRAIVAAGVGYRFGNFDFLLGGAYSPPVTLEVTQSHVRAGNTDASVQQACAQTPTCTVGLGTYVSGGYIATLGIRGRFGGAP